MTSQRQARRTAVAALCGLLMVPTLAGASFWSAGEPPLPDATVPLPAIGDRGIYRVTLEGTWLGDGAEPQQEWAFEWGGIDDASHVPLMPAATVRLHTWGEAWPPDMPDGQEQDRLPLTDLAISTQNGEVVAAQIRSGSEGVAKFGVEPLQWEGPQQVDRFAERTEFINEPIRACLVSGLHQGVPLDQAAGTGPAPCHLPFITKSLPAGLAVEPQAVTTISGDLPALHAVGQKGTWSLDTWVAPNTPYPLRLEATDGDGRAVYELVGVEAGTGPVIDIGAGPTKRPAVLPVTARTALGPEPGGWSPAWPLEAFYEQARDDPSWSDLRDYLQDHPDAQVTSANYGTTGDGAGVGTAPLEQWSITLFDGQAGLSFRGQRTQGTPGPVAYLTYTYGEEHLPDPSLWPDDLPAFQTVRDAFQGLATEAGTVAEPFLGFWMWCHEPCGEPEILVGAIAWEREYSLAGMQPNTVPDISLYGATGAFLALYVDQDGRPQRVIDTTTARSTQVSAMRQLQALQEADGAAPAPAASLAPYNDLPAPTPWPWVGAGLLSVLLLALLLSGAKAKAALWIGFTRLKHAEIVHHPTRARLLEIVQEEPGVHLMALTRRTGLAKTTVLHHIRKLLHAGAIHANRDHGFTCYYPARQMDYKVMAALPLLKSDAARGILEYTVARPGISLSDVATHAGVKVSTANYHVQRLKACGLVDVERNGRAVALRVSSLGREALAHGA